jgi:hypothetical protein
MDWRGLDKMPSESGSVAKPRLGLFAFCVQEFVLLLAATVATFILVFEVFASEE